MTQNLSQLPNFRKLMQKVDADPIWNLMMPAIIMSITRGIIAYQNTDPDWNSLDTRIIAGVEEAAGVLLESAEIHGIKRD